MNRSNHLFMVRLNLLNVPEPTTPLDTALRCYSPGDETAWLGLIRAAYGSEWGDDTFQRCVHDDESFLPERLLLCWAGDRLVGAVGAMQKLIYGGATGYVHMLAVHPEFRRRGVGTLLLRQALHYFRRQDWRNAVLDTERARLDAIRLYLAHGFLPLPENADELAAWQALLPGLGHQRMGERLRVGVVYDDRR